MTACYLALLEPDIRAPPRAARARITDVSRWCDMLRPAPNWAVTAVQGTLTPPGAELHSDAPEAVGAKVVRPVQIIRRSTANTKRRLRRCKRRACRVRGRWPPSRPRPRTGHQYAIP